MEAKLNDPDCTCSALTKKVVHVGCSPQWWTVGHICGVWSTVVDCGPQLWTIVHYCGLWLIWTKQYKYTTVTQFYRSFTQHINPTDEGKLARNHCLSTSLTTDINKLLETHCFLYCYLPVRRIKYDQFRQIYLNEYLPGFKIQSDLF